METSNISQKIESRILDDLTVRFVLNVEEFIYLNPEEYFFVLEEAYWFALDFYKIKFVTLPVFAEQLFKHNNISVDVLSEYIGFKKYKQSVKVFGAMLFSPDLSHVLLVKQSNHNNNITFPKGKKSKNESGMECAVRETLEEVGYDASDKILDISVSIFDKITFYCVFNVNMAFPFKTKTRNEISKIFWFDLKHFNDVKNRKDYKIFAVAYKAIQKQISDIRKAQFKFDRENIINAMDKILQ